MSNIDSVGPEPFIEDAYFQQPYLTTGLEVILSRIDITYRSERTDSTGTLNHLEEYKYRTILYS